MSRVTFEVISSLSRVTFEVGRGAPLATDDLGLQKFRMMTDCANVVKNI